MSSTLRVPVVAFAALGLLVLVPACPGSDAMTDGDAGAGDASPAPSPSSGPAGCGRTTTPCPAGGACEGAPDCEGGVCRANVCQTPSPADGTKDGDETDVDCGGKSAPACADGKGCLVAADCASGVCTGGVCKAPTHGDGLKNGDETGVDCGGPTAPKCATGQGCKTTADCANVACDPATHLCLAPSATDGIQNADETDVDCGGTKAPGCATGKKCKATSDCDKALCDVGKTNVCLPPSSTDAIKNGTETDVDCGGGAPTNAPKCGVGKTCALHADCASDGCGYDDKCALARSCAPHYGGDTCGKGEVGAAGAAHESCCASYPLPGANIRVDKYEITAGRMREFISRVGNDVQGWVNANRGITSQIPDAMVQYLPSGMNTPSLSIKQCDKSGGNCQTVTQTFGVYSHLGNTVFEPDRPCPNCGQGCWVGPNPGDDTGHPTYWWPEMTQVNQFGAVKRAFDQNTLDTKSLNCVAELLLAAFCAWDGGRLPTQAELGGTSGAWGPSAWPWGGASYRDTLSTADPGRIAYPYPPEDNQPAWLVPALTSLGVSNIGDATKYNRTNWNPFNKNTGGSAYLPDFRYVWPAIAPANFTQTDQAYAIAAPGRMYNDFRAIGAGPTDGYYDVLGNLLEATADFVGTDDANHNAWPQVLWVGASFEGHDPTRGGYYLNVLTKYGKQGGRCVRPM